MVKNEQFVRALLSQADLQINGKRRGDITINNPAFYSKVMASGSLGLGESYMDGWWDCNGLDIFFYKLLKARLYEKTLNWTRYIFPIAKAKLINLQSKSRAFEVGEKHYDAGNDLYRYMLDKRLVYTCAYWKNATTLDKAQEAKLDLVCKKVGLKKGMNVLDIGCGWGSFAKFAAERYNVRVTGITISREQVKLAREFCKGLPVKIRLQDYRDLNEKFDRIVSLGMFEHVGVKNYATYMTVVDNCLKNNGLFLLHTIGRNTSSYDSDPWITKYIFPNGMLPSPKQITAAAEGHFTLEDWHNFGADYDKTLMAWNANFVKNWSKINKDYSERFYRMWTYYLLSCAGSFRARDVQLWQIVFSKGLLGGYHSTR